MNKKGLFLIVGVAALALGWYAFRPERLFVDETVSEGFPTTTEAAGMPQAVSFGMFHSVAHETRGTATIYEVAGKRVLRFTDFETSNGPDVQIYLVAADDASDNETVTKAGFIHLGAMKGNKGDQNYDVPADVDLDKYKSVTVWCRRFGVNFATAPLMRREEMPVVLSRGTFHNGSHETRGVATLYELSGGKRVLRFTEFETSNGPDLQVYLGFAPDAYDDDTVVKSGFFHLAALKGNIGDQNYEVPSNVNLDKVKSVTVWCKRFSKNFGTAPLSGVKLKMAS